MSIKLKRVLASVVSLAMLVTFINIPAVSGKVLAESEELTPTEGIVYSQFGRDIAGVFSGGDVSGDIVIADSVEINGQTFPVTKIGNKAFENNVNITSVIFPSSITEIDSTAFNGCTNLESLRIPENCTNFPHVWTDFPNLNIEYPCRETAGLTMAPGCTATPYHTGLTVSDNGFTCSGCSIEGFANCVGHSITLDSMIGVNFYYQIPDCILNNSAAYVQFSCNGELYCTREIKDYEQYEVIDDSGEVVDTYYIYSCPVAAKQMTDTIESQIIVPINDDNTWSSASESYSVAEYSNQLSSSDSDTSLRNVVRSMLIYGACAQEYFDYHTERLAYVLDSRDDLVNCVLNGFEEYKNDDLIYLYSDFKDMVAIQGPEDGVQLVAADLILGSTTSMGLYFTVPEELSDSNISYSVNFENYNVRRVGDRMYLVVNDIQPMNIVAAYPITVTVDGVEQSPMMFSPASYAYLVTDIVDDSVAPAPLQNLMRAMFLYGSFTYSYFGMNSSH